MQNYQPNPQRMPTIVQTGIQGFLTKVYVWMTVGLGLTALIAYMAASSQSFMLTMLTTPAMPIVLMVAQLGIVFGMSFLIERLNSTTAIALFVIYSMLTGLTFSVLLFVYTHESIVSTFFITAGMFAGFSFYGYSTKRDLTGIGSILIMALIGIIIASVVNIFMQSSAFQWAISLVGVVVFVGLTAYDTQRLKVMGEEIDMNNAEMVSKASIIGALSLYLNFINLFIMLLRLLGTQRD